MNARLVKTARLFPHRSLRAPARLERELTESQTEIEPHVRNLPRSRIDSADNRERLYIVPVRSCWLNGPGCGEFRSDKSRSIALRCQFSDLESGREESLTERWRSPSDCPPKSGIISRSTVPSRSRFASHILL